ncbi:MAG: carbamoyltransferase HypF [Nitrospiraceae bacterium]|nr:carbamoyltransferase HypF [Nitrospiraceae bacterium]
MGSMAERAQITLTGVVQGVGFRPYVFALASRFGIRGFVTNTAQGVLIDAEGEQLALFLDRLPKDNPPISRIETLSIERLHPVGYSAFDIRTSLDDETSFTLVSPDAAVCPDCLRELFDPSDRRFLYPFINCTNCGPRYSITQKVPYDRPNTTMARFTLCPDCSREYADPADRRFHAQPNACPVCGPNVEFKVQSSKYRVTERDPVRSAVLVLQQGGIAAVKGIGGFHIACDATNDDAVRLLRERKRKSNKPFAVMCPDVDAVRLFAEVSEREAACLLSRERPIVLLRKRSGTSPLSPTVAPGNQYVGCMLPYTPLHHLLFRPGGGNAHTFSALVMTSGNLSEEPIVCDNDEAQSKLSGLVDAFLLHDRDIFMRVDDSVARVQSSEFGVRRKNNTNAAAVSSLSPTELQTPDSELFFIRRSRGYAPNPIRLQSDGPDVMGCGADLKNTFTLTRGAYAIPSQHIGDMENYETLRFYAEVYNNLKAVYRAEPVALVHDLHPGYLSTGWAMEEAARKSIPAFAIQHHYAHIGSVMAEQGLSGPVIGVAFDGTGYGTDGNLWGSEFLVTDIAGFARKAHFRYVALPGGEAAIREPWRTAVSMLQDAFGSRCDEVLTALGFSVQYGQDMLSQIRAVAAGKDLSPLSSGAGRLFDAVSAILGICDRNTFEGEAAIQLESQVDENVSEAYRIELEAGTEYSVIDTIPLIRVITEERLAGLPVPLIAAKFHNTVAAIIARTVNILRERSGINDVALSGGTFQNRYLFRRVVAMLEEQGARVHWNRMMPPNDACISLGQAHIVRERLKLGDFPVNGRKEE